MQGHLRDRLLSPASLQHSGVATLANSCGVLGGCQANRDCNQDPSAQDAGETRRLSSTLDDIRTMVDGECNVYCAQQRILCRSTSLGTMFKESDAAVEASTEVVRNAKRTLRRTVGSATESPSVHGGHSAAGEDSGTEDTPAATSSGAASGSARRCANNAKGGLRQMAISVMNVIKSKGVASYCEVGDELVRQLLSRNSRDSYSDEKNVRRRVYDALNVLKAMDIIVPGPGRDLVWQGLPQGGGAGVRSTPPNNSKLDELRTQKRALLEQTKRLLDNVVQLAEYQQTLKRVALRNAEQSPHGLLGDGQGDDNANHLADKTIPYPFVLLQTHLHNTVNIQHTDDRMQYDLDFGRGALALVDPLGIIAKPCSSSTPHCQESRSAFAAPPATTAPPRPQPATLNPPPPWRMTQQPQGDSLLQPPPLAHVPPPPPLEEHDRVASTPVPLGMPGSTNLFGGDSLCGGFGTHGGHGAHDIVPPPLPRTATLPELPSMWGSAPAAPGLSHSQSFCAAEALTRFSSLEAPMHAHARTQYAHQHRDHLSKSPLSMPPNATTSNNVVHQQGWAMLADSMVSPPLYTVQPPQQGARAIGGGGMMGGMYGGGMGRVGEAMDCDSSMLSHATPLKPLKEGGYVGSCGGSPYDV